MDSNLTLDKILKVKRRLEKIQVEHPTFQASNFIAEGTIYKMKVPNGCLFILNIKDAYKFQQLHPEIQINFPKPPKKRTRWKKLMEKINNLWRNSLLAECIRVWNQSPWMPPPRKIKENDWNYNLITWGFAYQVKRAKNLFLDTIT